MLRPWQKDTRISLASLRKSSKVTQLRSTYGDSAGLDRWDDASGRPIQSMRPTEGKAPSVGAARSEARHSTAKSSRPRKVGEAGQPKRNGPRAGMATRSMKALSRKVVERGHHRLGRWSLDFYRRGDTRVGKNMSPTSKPMLKRRMMFENIDWSEDQVSFALRVTPCSGARPNKTIIAKQTMPTRSRPPGKSRAPNIVGRVDRARPRRIHSAPGQAQLLNFPYDVGREVVSTSTQEMAESISSRGNPAAQLPELTANLAIGS